MSSKMALRYWARWTIPFLICLMVAGVVFRRLPRQHPRAVSTELPVYGSIPDFSLISSQNKNVSLSDLKGKVWIADFVFTHCAGPCPLMSGTMKQLVKKFPSEAAVRFVSFSVDPDRDTPEVLSEYARRYSADPEKWFFLTGDKAQIYQLSERHFHLGVGEVPAEERENADQSVRHSSKFVLVDADARMRGFYDSASADEISKLIQDANQLLKKASFE